eukprot:1503858-Rhodomonas_salina.1
MQSTCRLKPKGRDNEKQRDVTTNAKKEQRDTLPLRADSSGSDSRLHAHTRRQYRAHAYWKTNWRRIRDVLALDAC